MFGMRGLYGQRVQNDHVSMFGLPNHFGPAALPECRRAFAVADTELELIAIVASMCESNQPVSGYTTPAANGMPSALQSELISLPSGKTLKVLDPI